MKNKIFRVLGVILLIVFSFFYTEKVIEILKNKDPIMKQIKKEEYKFKDEAIDAVLKENSIIPGVGGREVDIDKSYKKMRQYGKYKESLLVFSEVKPSISVDDYYDKYLSSGNDLFNNISLVFKVERTTNIDNILNILETTGVKATFFVDGLWLENNQEKVSSMNNLGYEVEVMHYNGTYDEVAFSNALSILRSVTSKNNNYCYAEYDQKEVLELCSKIGIHTIIPTIKVNNKPYMEIKKRVVNGSIISMKVNTVVEQELEIVINYLKQKGYQISNIETLLKEK